MSDEEVTTVFNQFGESDVSLGEEYDDQSDMLAHQAELLHDLRADLASVKDELAKSQETCRAQAALISALKAEFTALGTQLCRTAGTVLHIGTGS